jgi:hypothetical protein
MRASHDLSATHPVAINFPSGRPEPAVGTTAPAVIGELDQTTQMDLIANSLMPQLICQPPKLTQGFRTIFFEPGHNLGMFHGRCSTVSE